jgi:hypothetical protein
MSCSALPIASLAEVDAIKSPKVTRSVIVTNSNIDAKGHSSPLTSAESQLKVLIQVASVMITGSQLPKPPIKPNITGTRSDLMPLGSDCVGRQNEPGEEGGEIPVCQKHRDLAKCHTDEQPGEVDEAGERYRCCSKVHRYGKAQLVALDRRRVLLALMPVNSMLIEKLTVK